MKRVFFKTEHIKRKGQMTGKERRSERGSFNTEHIEREDYPATEKDDDQSDAVTNCTVTFRPPQQILTSGTTALQRGVTGQLGNKLSARYQTVPRCVTSKSVQKCQCKL